MRLRITIGLCLLSFLLELKAYSGDSDTVSSVNLTNFNIGQNEYREKIYVSLDKNFYLSGEHLRFKIYCLDASTKRSSALSKVAYLELLDTGNNSVIQTKIYLRDGIGYGDFFIPSNFNSGNYILRSYTKWMKNFGADQFFHSIIQIINPFKKAGLMPLSNSGRIILKFFPEGGSLIYGLNSKIAFRATDHSGKGIDFQGAILDDSDSSILEFSPYGSGLGSFFLKPEMNKSYRAKIMLKDSSEIIYKLPEIKYQGYLMHVDGLNDQAITIEVRSGDPSKDEKLQLTGKVNGIIQFNQKLEISDGLGKIRINPIEIEPGILQINLADMKGKLLNQREVLVYPKKEINLDIETDKETYMNREKITVKLSTKDLEEMPVNMDLSISVSAYNADFGQYRTEINPFFLLNNELRGLLENPVDHFEAGDDGYKIVMDNLVLTRTNFDSKHEDPQDHYNSIKYIPEFRYHIITGKLTNRISKLPEPGIITYLSIPSKYGSFFAAESKSDGKLFFEISHPEHWSKVILQTDYSLDNNYVIELEDPFSKDFSNINIPRFDLNEGMRNFLEKTSKNMQIQNAYVKYAPSYIINSNNDSLTFFEPDAVYYLDDYTRFPVMEEVMREYIAGVYVRRNQDGYHFKILDLDRTETFQENPLILLDGITVFDADEIMEFDPLLIKKIETVRKRFIKDGFKYSGIVSFSTYNGDFKGYQLQDKALVVEYDGVQPTKKYISPEYVALADKNSRLPDYRNVLYWNPEVKTDEKGEAILEFFASDDISEYEIHVEGISNDGRAVCGTTMIQVVNDSE